MYPIAIFLRSTNTEDGADVFHQKLVNTCQTPGDTTRPNVVIMFGYDVSNKKDVGFSRNIGFTCLPDIT